MLDKESINEHIRNVLSPIQLLREFYNLYKQTTDLKEKKDLEKMIDEIIEKFPGIINCLCELGKNSFEDENIWIEAKSKI